MWVSWMRSQCPRAGHSGLRHCTVQPGRYCIVSPRSERGLRRKVEKAAERPANKKRPVKQAGLCAERSSVSRKIYTISRGRFAESVLTTFRQEKSGRTPFEVTEGRRRYWL
jgi:hypothetical protein